MLWAIGLTAATKDLISFRMYLIAIGMYILFSAGIFFFARKMIQMERHYTFNGVVSISFLIKLVMSIGIIYLVEHLYAPISNAHIFHYLLIYIIYTIYEVYFLTKLGRT